MNSLLRKCSYNWPFISSFWNRPVAELTWTWCIVMEWAGGLSEPLTPPHTSALAAASWECLFLEKEWQGFWKAPSLLGEGHSRPR